MKSILTSMAASTLLATIAIAQTPRYNVTDLGTLGGTSSDAYGINYAGRAAGAASLPNGNTHAFLSGIPGTMYDLGTLGGDRTAKPAGLTRATRCRFLPRLPRKIR